MRTFVILTLGLAFLAGSVMAESPHVKSYKMKSSRSHILNGCDVDIDGGSLIIERRGRRGVKMEITEEYVLLVDDHKIETDTDQQKLVVATYDGSMLLIEYARDIGLEGASIGIEGAKLGLKAVGGVFKMMFTGYDHEDLEEDMEAEADKLERRADKLEKRADKIEGLVEDLEVSFTELIDKTPELERLK